MARYLTAIAVLFVIAFAATADRSAGGPHPSGAVLHLLTWIEGPDGVGDPGPDLPPAQFAPYVNFALLAAGGGELKNYGAAGITTVLYSEPNHYLPHAKMKIDQLFTMGDVADDCAGAKVLWNKPGMPQTWVTDVRMPHVAQAWAESVALTVQQNGPPNIVFEDSSDAPYWYASPAPPCDPHTRQTVTPQVWSAATEVMESKVGYPVLFNGLMNGSSKKVPDGLLLVNGPAIGGLAELCYGSDQYDQGIHKNNDVAWQISETTEITFALAHKLFVCHNNETTDGSVPAALDARMYQLSSFLLTYDLSTSVYGSKWAVGPSNTKVQPEEQFVPVNPEVAEPATIGVLLGADGNYHRRYADCYMSGVDRGRCDVIVNSSKNVTNGIAEEFTIGHGLVLQGSGIFDGGTASIVSGTLTSLAPTESAIVFP